METMNFASSQRLSDRIPHAELLKPCALSSFRVHEGHHTEILRRLPERPKLAVSQIDTANLRRNVRYPQAQSNGAREFLERQIHILQG